MAKVYFQENVDCLPIPWVDVGLKSEQHMWTGVGLYDRSDHRAKDCRLYPLIHTFPPGHSPRVMGVGSKEQKWELKYVMFSWSPRKAKKYWPHPSQIAVRCIELRVLPRNETCNDCHQNQISPWKVEPPEDGSIFTLGVLYNFCLYQVFEATQIFAPANQPFYAVSFTS